MADFLSLKLAPPLGYERYERRQRRERERLRLDCMNGVIQNMITLTLEQGKMYDRRHEQIMAEIEDLIILQKEHRIPPWRDDAPTQDS